MTSDKGDDSGDDPGNDPGGKGSGPKKSSPASRRPAPTIDLKATELASEPVVDERRAADKTAQAPASDTAAKSETPQPGTESRIKAKTEPEREAKVEPKAGPKTESRTESRVGGVPPRGPDQSTTRGRFASGLSLPLIAIAAAAGIVLFLLGLATANLFIGRQVAANAQLDRAQAVDDLTERLRKIEAALSAPRAPDAALSTRIGAVEAAARLATENAAAQQRRAEELAAQVREVRSRADAAAASAEAVHKNAAAAAPAGARVDVDALNQRIAALEQALKANEAELARRTGGGADDRKSRIAVASSILLGAVERGAPFAAELAAAKALTQDTKALAPLENFAPNGVPGAAAMSRELVSVIPAMLKTAEIESPRDGGFLDKLQANAERLVRIRPVGETAGDQPAHVIARIEAKAKMSDIAGALEDLSKLPPQIRAPAESWIKKANARNAALAAARQFSTGALAAIGKPNT